MPWWNSFCDVCLLVAIIKHGSPLLFFLNAFILHSFSFPFPYPSFVAHCIYFVPGYEQFALWRADTALCFNAIVGKQQKRTKKGKKSSPKTPTKGVVKEEDDDDIDPDEFGLDEEESEGEEILLFTPPPPPPLKLKKYSAGMANHLMLCSECLCCRMVVPGQLEWPSLADINTRSRRLVNAYLKQQKREEHRQAQILKVYKHCYYHFSISCCIWFTML